MKENNWKSYITGIWDSNCSFGGDSDPIGKDHNISWPGRPC